MIYTLFADENTSDENVNKNDYEMSVQNLTFLFYKKAKRIMFSICEFENRIQIFLYVFICCIIYLNI